MHDHDNTGFFSRRERFIAKYVGTVAHYKTSGSPFAGKLFHDLSSFEGGILSGIKCSVTLKHAKESFRLMNLTPTAAGQAEDKEPYRMIVTKASLLCPIGTMTPEAYLQVGIFF
jgi:hypothetical protein